MTGIYKIKNLINGHAYIGQARNIINRWKRHKSTAFNENDRSYDNPLYRAIRKYGIENFSFEVIEECKISELNEKERYWIQKYNTFFDGYNLTMGGNGGGTSQKKDSIIGIIHDLETTNLLQREIAEKWKISEEMVQGINTGRYWKYDRDYPIRGQSKFHPIKKIKYFCSDCGKEVTKGATRCTACENKRRTQNKPITREELKSLIRTMPFLQIGKRYGVSDNAIRRWCDAYGLPRKAREIKKYSDKDWEDI